MTIIAGVTAPDGIILAADSRTVQLEGPHHRTLSDSAIKVFSVRGCLGVATYGIASIGGRTIAGLMSDFETTLRISREDGRALAEHLGEFFHERLTSKYPLMETDEDAWPLGFLVAGYDRDGRGELFEVRTPSSGPEIEALAGTVHPDDIGYAYRGQTDAAERLLKGFDWERGSEIPFSDEVVHDIRQLAYRPMSPISLQDAIDFAEFVIRTTIDAQRFTDGTLGSPWSIPGCGGPIRILAVTTTGCQWIADHPLRAGNPSGRAEGA